MGTSTDIGFHAVRVSYESTEIASGANAIVGAYLYKIGVTDFRTIGFLTSAPPQHMTWVNQRNAHIYKLDVKTFNLSDPQWTWTREALAGSGPPPHINPPTPVPATRPARSASSERTQNPAIPVEPKSTERVIEQAVHVSPEPGTATQIKLNGLMPGAVHVRSDDLIAQASRRVENGDVAGAREMLAAAEDGREGLVSFALAETYDPNMLAAWGTRGVAGDITRARALYRRALDLGVTAAYSRLEALK
jgi:hypothetical protein